MRDDSASPSSSRTVGSTRISRSRFRSRTMRRITAACCASFWPKYARCGRTMLKSFRQTVATPRKWPGRASPSAPALARRRPRLRSPAGYISSAAGANRTSTPSASAISQSRCLVARIRGEVGGVAELRRVDEERRDDEVVLGARGAEERRGGRRAARPSSARARRRAGELAARRSSARSSCRERQRRAGERLVEVVELGAVRRGSRRGAPRPSPSRRARSGRSARSRSRSCAASAARAPPAARPPTRRGATPRAGA